MNPVRNMASDIINFLLPSMHETPSGEGNVRSGVPQGLVCRMNNPTEDLNKKILIMYIYIYIYIYMCVCVCSSSSSSSCRTDRWVHFQQNAGLRLFVHT